MTDQPEALRVADLMAQRVKPRVIHATGQTQQPAGFKPDRECIAAALLLREQHAEIERLREALREAWRISMHLWIQSAGGQAMTRDEIAHPISALDDSPQAPRSPATAAS
jgi:hypothetical protein